jgi:hypothetical protein
MKLVEKLGRRLACPFVYKGALASPRRWIVTDCNHCVRVGILAYCVSVAPRISPFGIYSVSFLCSYRPCLSSLLSCVDVFLV